VVVLAGCGSKDTPSDDPQTTPPDQPPVDNETLNGTIDNGTIPPVALPRNMELNGCTLQGSAFTWPTSMAPGDYPPGWDPATPIATDFDMNFFECQRFAWGPFERPLVFVLETHTKRTAPDACAAAGSYDVDNILQRFWTNDTEVAAYLESTYDMPVGVANITHEDTEEGPAHLRTWTFLAEGTTTPSTLTYPKQMGPDTPGEFILRVVWWNATMLGTLDLAETYGYAYPGSTDAVAHMEPPTLAGTLPIKDSIGGSAWKDDLDGSGTILLWRDTACTEPF
jgi:hypothetical protein